MKEVIGNVLSLVKPLCCFCCVGKFEAKNFEHLHSKQLAQNRSKYIQYIGSGSSFVKIDRFELIKNKKRQNWPDFQNSSYYLH